MRRELAIALRARITWIVAALAALLVGHGFVLAVDLFSASSRSALASALQTREMDPLAGVVRPTLGGLDLALVLLGPLLAARQLAVEKERRTMGALCLAEGSPSRVVLKKMSAALLCGGLVFAAPMVLLGVYRWLGGHLDFLETGTCFAGTFLRWFFIAAVSLAGAAWTRSLAQAATFGIAISLTSWAIDAADGFAALSWLGGASAWSIERKLLPFQKGILAAGPFLWLLTATMAAIGIACVGASFDPSLRRKLGMAIAILFGAGILLAVEGHVRGGFDWTEERRASLPPAVVEGLRAMHGPIELEVALDRDDSRRRQLESDVLEKLTLARSDIIVRMPLDETATATEAQRDVGYGRILIRAGGGTRETRSTSRREIVTLVFEAAGRTLPDWNQLPYPGFPVVFEGARRWLLLLLAYAAIPLAMLAIGLYLSQGRTAR